MPRTHQTQQCPLSDGAASAETAAVEVKEGATRADYDPVRNSVSLLAVGDLGWQQIAHFIVMDLLMLAFAGGCGWRPDPSAGQSGGPPGRNAEQVHQPFAGTWHPHGQAAYCRRPP
jgi:hypothetical protein